MLRSLAKQALVASSIAAERRAVACAGNFPMAVYGQAPADTARPPCAWYSTDQFRKLVHSAAARSLEFQRQPAGELNAEAQRSMVVRALLTFGGYYSKESRHMRAAQRLYAAVTEQATCPCFLQAMGIPENFQSLHSSLCLHTWMLLVRLRPEGKDGKQLGQMLYDDFQTDVEERVRQAGVKVRIRKQLTDLEQQFYGSSMAYDRALQQNNEPLEKALLRNVYCGRDELQPDAQLLARYVRRELACLALTPTAAVMNGNVKFSAEGLQGDKAPHEGLDAAAAAAAAGAGHDLAHVTHSSMAGVSAAAVPSPGSLS